MDGWSACPLTEKMTDPRTMCSVLQLLDGGHRMEADKPFDERFRAYKLNQSEELQRPQGSIMSALRGIFRAFVQIELIMLTWG